MGRPPPDRARIRSIKVPFGAILHNQEDKRLFLRIANGLNPIVQAAYELVRLWVLDKWKNNDPVPVITELHYGDALSIIHMKGKGRTTIPRKVELLAFYHSDYVKHIPEGAIPNLKGIGTILQSYRTTMFTAFQNNLQKHYTKRVFRLVVALLQTESVWGLTQATSTEINRTAGKISRVVLDRERSRLESKYQTLYDRLQPELAPGDQWLEDSLNYHLKTDPGFFLKGTLWIAEQLEHLGRSIPQALPLRRQNVPGHYTLFTKDLLAISDFGNKTKMGTAYSKNMETRHMIWSRYIDFSHPVFRQRGYSFDYQIDTDGWSCTLKFVKGKYQGGRKPKVRVSAWSPPRIETLDKQTLHNVLQVPNAGNDPGNKRIMQLLGTNRKTVTYTRAQHYRDSEFQRNEALREKIAKKVELVAKEAPLSNVNGCTVSSQKFLEYIQVQWSVRLQTQRIYQKSLYRSMHYHAFQAKQRSFSDLVMQIKRTYGKKVAIFCGDWSGGNRKGTAPVPNKGVLRHLAKFFWLLSIHEFRTSCRCAYCHKPIRKRKIQNGEIYRVLECKGCSALTRVGGTRWIHRDINGALNILNLGLVWAKKQKRPIAFRREARATSSHSPE